MTAVLSALPLVALFLAGWTTLSVLAVPVLALCLRSQARVNARVTGRLRRDAWNEQRISLRSFP